MVLCISTTQSWDGMPYSHKSDCDLYNAVIRLHKFAIQYFLHVLYLPFTAHLRCILTQWCRRWPTSVCRGCCPYSRILFSLCMRLATSHLCSLQRVTRVDNGTWKGTPMECTYMYPGEMVHEVAHYRAHFNQNSVWFSPLFCMVSHQVTYTCTCTLACTRSHASV